VKILFEDGQQVPVPPDALTRQPDGSFVLALRDAQLGQHSVVIPVVREQLAVERRVVDGERGVRVHKTVTTRDHRVDEPVLRDEVQVERVPLNAVVREPPPVRYEGDTTIIPVCEEVVVIEKRLLVKEELRITRTTTQTRHTEIVPLRYEHVEVERFDDPAPEMRATTSATPFPDDADAVAAPALFSPR
jgi:uncharacterized protein (TIGR02271 family)